MRPLRCVLFIFIAVNGLTSSPLRSADAELQPSGEGECTHHGSQSLDFHPDCAAWARLGECNKNPDYMGRACAASCVGKIQLPAAEDTSPHCARWAEDGECVANPQFMALSCGASCAGKIGPAPSAPARMESMTDAPLDQAHPVALGGTARNEPLVRRDIAGCVDTRQDCAQLARGNLSGCGEAGMMLVSCRSTCEACSQQAAISALSDCSDADNNCRAWAAAGECVSNKRFMFSSCSKSCGVCQQKQSGCVRKNAAAGTTAPSGMRSMFERALADFPQYEPTALSTDPFVLQFENLVTAEEATAIIALPGNKLFRSKAGDHVSPVRTSTQFWCEDADGCADDATVRDLTERMTNITQMPAEYAEFLQILRYEAGQFYRVHHDQQSAHWTPQGVRVYTFFVYLSDVEQGGGTKFNDLGLTVTPKVGRAVLWPNVRGEDLRTSEPRTHHEALPVDKGVKYGANLWIHLYDYRTPSRDGTCPFVGMNTLYDSESVRAAASGAGRIHVS